MTRHPQCLYPACRCLQFGATCRVAEAAEIEPYCSHCGRVENELPDCELSVCTDGLAEMINPLQQAISGWRVK